MINLLISVVVAGLLFWLFIWFIDWVSLPDPFNKVAKVIVGLVALIYLLNLLGGLGYVQWPALR